MIDIASDRHLTQSRRGARAAVPEPRTSAAAVRRATGRDRSAWFALLDAWGGAERRHGEIVAWLIGEHGVDNWWAQSLTVDYEQARGLRPPGGGRDGTFTVSVSRTVAVSVDRLFAAVVDPALRDRWLPDRPLRERTSQPGRSARFDWGDGTTRVNVGFTAKGRSRCQLELAHERLPDARAAEQAKAYWRERLAALKTLLEG